MDWMLILTIALFLGLGGLWVYTLITGKNIHAYIDTASKMLDAASEAQELLGDMFPSDAISLTLAITDIAKTAAANAEQLFLNGSIGKDERKEAARRYVFAALDAMGVEVNDAIRIIVDGAIEAACLLDIPHM